MNKSFYTILILLFTVYSKDFISLTADRNRLYLLNGLESYLRVIDKDNNEVKNIDLRSFSGSGLYDHFISDNEKKYYLTDSQNSSITLLDEKFRKVKETNTFETYSIKIYKKIFPISYNSVLISSDDKTIIYRLENNVLQQLINIPDGFIDFFYQEHQIYVLKENNIEIYNINGVKRSGFDIKTTNSTSEIFFKNNRIFVYNNDKLRIIDTKGKKLKVIELNSDALAIIKNTIYYFSNDSLKFRDLND